jgi:hypothetical protein
MFPYVSWWMSEIDSNQPKHDADQEKYPLVPERKAAL